MDTENTNFHKARDRTAQAKRFGFKRARWRGQWRVQIQDYLIAVVQNIQLLIAHGSPGQRAAVPAGTLMAIAQVVFVFLPLVSLMGAL